jgi:hypothetical protein
MTADIASVARGENRNTSPLVQPTARPRTTVESSSVADWYGVEDDADGSAAKKEDFKL